VCAVWQVDVYEEYTHVRIMMEGNKKELVGQEEQG